MSTQSVQSVTTRIRGLSARRQVLLVIASLAAVAALTSACGGSNNANSTTTTTGSSGGSHATASITIKNFAFSPKTLTVTPGTKVEVTNKDTVTHTVTSDTNKFDTGNIDFNQTGSFTAPSQPGTYTYHCTIHPFMVGTLVVS